MGVVRRACTCKCSMDTTAALARSRRPWKTATLATPANVRRNTAQGARGVGAWLPVSHAAVAIPHPCSLHFFKKALPSTEHRGIPPAMPPAVVLLASKTTHTAPNPGCHPQAAAASVSTPGRTGPPPAQAARRTPPDGGNSTNAGKHREEASLVKHERCATQGGVVLRVQLHCSIPPCMCAHTRGAGVAAIRPVKHPSQLRCRCCCWCGKHLALGLAAHTSSPPPQPSSPTATSNCWPLAERERSARYATLARTRTHMATQLAASSVP